MPCTTTTSRRREAFRKAIAGGIPAGYGAGDAAGLHFIGTELERVVSSRPGARAFLPTASGDPRDQVTRFYERFGSWPCEPSILSLFHLARDRIDPVAHLLAQDAIYVGGGSMRNLLAVWREHGVDEALRGAWEAGVVLAGLSAGAMCWFGGGISMSAGTPEAVRGLGFLDGSLSVHLDGEAQRLPVYRAAVAAGSSCPAMQPMTARRCCSRGPSLPVHVVARRGEGAASAARRPRGSDRACACRPAAAGRRRSRTCRGPGGRRAA